MMKCQWCLKRKTVAFPCRWCSNTYCAQCLFCEAHQCSHIEDRKAEERKLLQIHLTQNKSVDHKRLVVK